MNRIKNFYHVHFPVTIGIVSAVILLNIALWQFHSRDSFRSQTHASPMPMLGSDSMVLLPKVSGGLLGGSTIPLLSKAMEPSSLENVQNMPMPGVVTDLPKPKQVMNSSLSKPHVTEIPLTKAEGYIESDTLDQDNQASSEPPNNENFPVSGFVENLPIPVNDRRLSLSNSANKKLK